MKKALLLGWLAVTGLAWAAQHKLVLTGQTQTVRLKGNDQVELVGDSNQVEFQGDCASLHLVGNNNRLRLDGQCSDYQVVGSGNVLQWVSRPGRRQPPLQSLGSNNQVVQIQP